MQLMENKFEGACLCQRVKFQVRLVNLKMHVCHCSMCRKSSGGTGFAYLYAQEAPEFRTQDTLASYNAVGKAERGFCNHCGTTIYYHNMLDKGYCISISVLEKLPENDILFNREWYYHDKPGYYAYANETQKS